MGKKLFISLIVIFTAFGNLRSQDFHYSQFYAAPLYLNPAMTGATELSRIGSNYRKQWPGLGHDFNSYSIYFDHYIFDYNSGIGISINSFEETNLNLKNTDLSVYYSYKLDLDHGRSIRMGGQAAYVMRSASLDNLVFGDQINLFNRNIDPVSIDQVPLQDPYGYLDVSFGLLYLTDKFWIGSSAHHVNQPSLSFFPDNNFNNLPLKWSVHAGVQFDLYAKNTRSDKPVNLLSISTNYKNQGPFQQLDLGIQQQYTKFIGGISYRGFSSYGDLPNQSSMVGILGVDLSNGLVIGYSYDYIFSQMGRSTKGAHEVSLRYQWYWGDPRDRNRRETILKCMF